MSSGMENLAPVRLNGDGGISVLVAPELGGRIMELSLGGFNFLFVNPALAGKKNVQNDSDWNGVWQNFGGDKIWPAPQGWDSDAQWHGPPDPVLDGGCFSITGQSERSLATLSPADHKTGLQIGRTISLLDGECGVKIDARFSNISGKTAEWSIWPVIQVAASASEPDRHAITFPAPNGYRVMHGVVNNPEYRTDEYGNCEVSYRYIIGKVGADSNGGWIAYSDKSEGRALAVSYDYAEGAKYPDGTNIQVWTSGRGAIYSRGVLRIENGGSENPPYMEMELLSPLTSLNAGETFGFSYAMKACAILPGFAVRSVFGAGVVTEGLSVKKCQDSFLISASIGVFAEGRAVLKTDSGTELCEPEIVSPSCGKRISASLPLSALAGAREIILEYFNSKNTLVIEKAKLYE